MLRGARGLKQRGYNGEICMRRCDWGAIVCRLLDDVARCGETLIGEAGKRGRPDAMGQLIACMASIHATSDELEYIELGFKKSCCLEAFYRTNSKDKGPRYIHCSLHLHSSNFFELQSSLCQYMPEF